MNTSKFVAPNTVFDSSVSFKRNVTFDSSVYLQGVTHISSPTASTDDSPYVLVVESIGADVEIKARELGTMAFETSTNYYGKAEVDALISDVSSSLDTRLDNIDISISALDVLTQIHDDSIGYLDSYVVDLSSRIGTIDDWQTYVDGSLAERDASIANLVDWQVSQDASIQRIDASLNDVVDITEVIDASLSDLYIGLSDVSTRVDNLETWQSATDASIEYLFNWDTAKDASIVQLRTDITDLSTRTDTRLDNHDTSILTLNNLIQNIDSSLDLFVAKAGDTMTGPLTISAGGLQVAGDVSITASGDLYVDGDTTIKGNLTINGSLYVVDVETIDVSGTYIHLNTGLTGAPPASLQSGIIVGRGTSDPYVFVYDETNQTFRIGIATLAGSSYQDASTQAVATRQDAPLANGIAYWNDTEKRFDTSTGFTIIYLQNQIAQLDASVVQNRTDINDVSVRLANFSPTDLSIRISNLETSVGNLDLLTQTLDSSIDYLFAWDYAKDASIVQLRSDIGEVSTRLNTAEGDITNIESSVGVLDVLTQKHDSSIGFLLTNLLDVSADKISAVANVPFAGTVNASIFSYESNNVAYLRQIVAGSGATITQDSSTITIAVSGVAGYVRKYKSTFDGTASASIGITAAVHGLGTGPLDVTVYENNQVVYPDIDVDALGNVVIEWAPGSLTDVSCKYVIMG